MSLDPIIVAPVVFAGVMIASVPMVFVAVIMGALAVPLFMALIAMSAVECGLKGRGWLRTEGVSIYEAAEPIAEHLRSIQCPRKQKESKCA